MYTVFLRSEKFKQNARLFRFSTFISDNHSASRILRSEKLKQNASLFRFSTMFLLQTYKHTKPMLGHDSIKETDFCD